MSVRRGNGEGSIFQSEKKGRWLGQLIIGRKENGAFIRKTVYGKTRQEVKNKITNLTTKLETHTYVEKKDTKVYELAKEIVMDKIEGNLVSESTHRRDLYTLSQIKGSALANMKIQDVKPTHIKSFMNSKTEFSNSSLVKIFQLLGKVFRRAIDRDIIIKNPMLAEETKRPKSKKPDRKIISLSVSEELNLIRAIKGHKYENIINLMLCTGMRIGEVLALTKDDIKDGYIHISRTITRDRNERIVIGKNTKTFKSNRRIKIIPIVEEILNKVYRDYFPNTKKLLFFNPRTGKFFTPGNVNAYLRRLNQTKHIAPELHNHMLRHTFATRCIESGLNPKTVQHKMGHAEIETTLGTYCDVFESYENKEDDKINDFFKNTFFQDEDTNKIIPIKKEA